MFNFLFREKKHLIKPTLLIVYDGWGIAPESEGNPMTKANIPNFRFYTQNYPYTSLIASGESVGLPANVVGNSEVGHLTIGAGRVIDESLVRINKAIDDSSFYENDAFLAVAKHVRQNKTKLHLVGLASSGNVHSSMKHLNALIEFAIRQDIPTVLHLFTDGRDAPPTDAVNVVREVELKIAEHPNIKVGSISGRYYAMDRDARWERTKLLYDCLVKGTGNTFKTASDAINYYYKSAITDEFIPPSCIVNQGITAPQRSISDNDGIIFFNFRVDRARQLAMSFTVPDFEHLSQYEWGFDMGQGNNKVKKASGPTFERGVFPKNLFTVSITEYQKQLPVNAVAYPPVSVPEPFPEVISKAGLNQFHLAESEKERMVTYYFDGLRTERFLNEDVEIVSSPHVPTYDKKPEMSVFGLVKKLKAAISKDKYSFIVMNIANPDMVAHTGNLEATIKALEATDKATGEIVDVILKYDGSVFITADHGNAEELITYDQSGFFFTSEDGSTNTEHSNNPVPFLFINKAYLGKTDGLKEGRLSDVAPTILAVMGIQVPKTMTGISLLNAVVNK